MSDGRVRFVGLAVLGCAVFAAPTAAQNPPDDLPDNNGRTAAQNAALAGLGRRPGQMVRDGLIQHATFGRGASPGVEVTETEEESIEASLIADVIDILFEQLVSAIEQFEALLRARAGLPPRTSTLLSIPTSTAETTDTTDTADADGTDSTLGSVLSGLLGRKQREP